MVAVLVGSVGRVAVGAVVVVVVCRLVVFAAGVSVEVVSRGVVVSGGGAVSRDEAHG